MLLRIRFVLLLVMLPGLVLAQYGNPYGYPRQTRRTAGPNNGVPNGVTPLVTMRGALRLIDKKKSLLTPPKIDPHFQAIEENQVSEGRQRFNLTTFRWAAVVIEASRA